MYKFLLFMNITVNANELHIMEIIRRVIKVNHL